MASSSAAGGDLEVGFAKLQGEDFEYYMQTYSIVLGRNSKRAEVDVDLASLGGGMSISRHHARIFYDFSLRRFALEVLGKNGCFVEGVLHVPSTSPVKLDSQDLLQIGDKRFYFLLPTRSVFSSSVLPRHQAAPPKPQTQPPRLAYQGCDDDDDNDEDEVDEEEEEWAAKRMKSDAGRPSGRHGENPICSTAKKLARKSRANNREADDHQLRQLEEEDVMSSVATVLTCTCGPGEWMHLAKLHAEMMKQYGNIWHHSRVRRYLASEDWTEHETQGKPWFGLLILLRKHPEQFVINTRSKGRTRTEFVSLVSLIS